MNLSKLPQDLLKTAIQLGFIALPFLVVLLFLLSLRRNIQRRRVFTCHLRALVRLQLPLEQGLACTGRAVGHIRSMMRVIGRRLEEGLTLADAIGSRYAILPDWYVRMIEVGEQNGTLEHSLDCILDADEDRENTHADLLQRLLYPLAVLTVCGWIFMMIILFIVPKFRYMFEEMNQPAPRLAYLVPVVDFLVRFWYLFPLGFGLLALWVFAVFPFPWGPRLCRNLSLLRTFRYGVSSARYALSRLCPSLFRQVYRPLFARWAVTVGALLKAGCTLPQALEEAVSAEGDPHFSAEASDWADRVKRGESLGAVLEQSPLAPGELVWHIKSTETGESLPEALQQVGRRMAERMRRRYGIFISALTPLLILLVGLVIGYVCWALFGTLVDIVHGCAGMMEEG